MLDIVSLRNQAVNHARAGRPEKAVSILRRAVKHSPTDKGLCLDFALALQQTGRLRDAVRFLERCCRQWPECPDIQGRLAILFERSNDTDKAARVAEHGLKIAPDHPTMNVVAARHEKRRGEIQAAIARLLRIQQHATGRIAASVQYELGELHDLSGHPDKAIQHFTLANKLFAESCREAAHLRETGRRILMVLHEKITAEWFARWTPAPVCDQEPVFLIGFPRSGTTLLNALLDSHPNIVCIEEKRMLTEVQRGVNRLPKGYPNALPELTKKQIKVLRRTYFDAAKQFAQIGPGKSLIDKYPLHILEVPLIHRLFPTARLVLALRHPYDVVLSCFMQNFQENTATVNFLTIKDAAWFYAETMGLWDQYQDIFPLRVHPIRYEDLVANPETEMRKLLSFLGLEWSGSVLDYAKRAQRRHVPTPSYSRVVKPIYSTSVGRYKQYAKSLRPIEGILRSYVEAFGYS